MNEKWIKLYSKMLDWEWYRSGTTMRVFIHCLLKANWKDGKFEGYDIPRGSFVGSIRSIANELSSKYDKVGTQSVRTAINHLLATHELTQTITPKFTIYTVQNYDLYQQPNTQANTRPTHNQHTTNTQLTTIEEYRIINSISSIEIIRAHVYEFYEKNFAILISSLEKEILDSWIDYFEDKRILLFGIQVAVMQRVTTMAYLNGIYQNWKDSKFKTLEDCKPKEKEKKEKLELFEYDWLNDEEPH